MNNVIFLFETFNPNKRTTFFKHRNYTKYLAYSEYAIKNKTTDHGLFGKIIEFPDIEKMQNIEPINEYIINLASNRIPIFRCTISLDEYDAIRLGYDSKEKWKELFESKLVSFAKKMNIKYEDLQYAGAVHLESGHPHLQVMMWSKQKEKMNYFIKYNLINRMKDEFTNSIFKEDLLRLYQEKDIAKQKIVQENQLLQNLKKVSNDDKFINDMMKYERDYASKKIIFHRIKYKDIKNIMFDLIEIKKMLEETKGSIKYQYLKKYPDIIKAVDNLSRKIIERSLDTQKQIDEYILARQKIITYKYSNKRKIEEAQKIEKQKAEDEIRKMIGNQILSFERVLLKQKEEYSKIMYHNETENLVYNIFNCVYFSARQEEKYIKNFEIRYKKQLSKQARKDLAINKSNSSKFHWEEEK